jgi:peptide/nickel transport system permease protein
MATGSIIGAVIGYFGGLLDSSVSRVVDVLMAFPLFVLAMALVAALGNTVTNVIYATAVINLPFYIRLARAEVRVQSHLGYIEAARVGGSGHARILGVFLLPNILPTLVVQASLNLGWAVLNAAGLSFIGLGVRAPTPEWGIMVADGAQFIVSGQWWIALFPGLALMVTVFCFNLLGDGLRDVVDPRSRT